MKTLWMAVLLVGLISTSAPADAGGIFIMGDSTMLGADRYIMRGLPCVTHPGNVRDTAHFVDKMGSWLIFKDYDIIYFNVGLWDIARRLPTPSNQWRLDATDKAPVSTSLEIYRMRLALIVQMLHGFQPNAKLIFATSTDVPEDSAGRLPQDLDAYNKAAIEVMEWYGVEVDNRHAFMLPYAYLHKMTGPNKVHYYPAGYQVMASHIIDILQMHGGCGH